MSFWGSLLGQGLGGAVLGGLTAKATGGDWRKGAGLGALGGALSYGSGSGGANMYGEGTQTFGQSGLGGLMGMGNQATQAAQSVKPNGLSNGIDTSAIVARNAAGVQSQVPNANAGGGLFEGWGDAIGEFGTKYKDTMDMAGKGLSTLGNIYSVYNQGQAADEEAARRRGYDAYTMSRTNEADDFREQQAKQAELAFNKSKLSSYY